MRFSRCMAPLLTLTFLHLGLHLPKQDVAKLRWALICMKHPFSVAGGLQSTPQSVC